MDDELEALRQRRLLELRQQVAATPSDGSRMRPTELDTVTLGPFVENHPLVLVDVWAAWCGPCRMMEPIVEELAHELKGRVGVGKVDADQSYDLLQRYGIQGIPTFLFFKNGSMVGRLVGARPKRDFLEVVRQLEAASAEPDQSVQ